MEPASTNLGQIASSSRQFVRQLFTVGENRLELLLVEVQEERERRLRAILLALGAAAFGALAMLALNVTIVIGFWSYSPVTVLLVMTGLYSAVAICLYRQLTRMLREWKMLSATLDQLKKDRECLEKSLA